MYNLTSLEVELLQRLEECERLAITLNELLFKANGYKYHYNAEKLFYNKPDDISEMKYTGLFDVLLITEKEYTERFTLKEKTENYVTFYDKKKERDIDISPLLVEKIMSNFGRSIICRSYTENRFSLYDANIEVYRGFIKSVKIREREVKSYIKENKYTRFEEIKIEI